MSRTDAHRPYWVLERDEFHLFTALHDHSTSDCDLADSIQRGARVVPGGCRLENNPSLPRRCHCELCFAGTWRRAARRKVRNRERHLLHAAVRGEEAVERLESDLLRFGRLC